MSGSIAGKRSVATPAQRTWSNLKGPDNRARIGRLPNWSSLNWSSPEREGGSELRAYAQPDDIA